MAASNGEGSMTLTVPHSGRPGTFGVTFVHVVPSSRETWTSPSSEPTQRSPFSRGDSAIAKIVPYHSTPVLSPVIGPPDHFCLLSSSRVRSGLIASQRLPAVACAEEHVGAVVDDLRVVRRDGDRRRPLDAVARELRAPARAVLRPGAHVARLAGAVVVAGEDAEVLAGVDDVRVRGVVRGVAGLAPAHPVPVAQRDPRRGEAVGGARRRCRGPAWPRRRGTGPRCRR